MLYAINVPYEFELELNSLTFNVMLLRDPVADRFDSVWTYPVKRTKHYDNNARMILVVLA